MLFFSKKPSRSGNKLPILSSVFIVMLLCVSGAFVMVNDSDSLDAAPIDDGLDYTVADGCLTISGTGPMTDYTISVNLHTLYTFSTCIIESGVTCIGSYAFSYAFDDTSNLVSIILPDSITIIGSNAFENCFGMESIILSDSVITIGDYAFHNCNNLTSIIIPSSVTSIGNNLFLNCSSLASVILSDSITSIKDFTFYECESLLSIIIPSSVTSIGACAFNGCTVLSTMYCAGSEGSITFNDEEGFPVPGTCTISYDVVLVPVSFDIGSATSAIAPTSQTIPIGSCATDPALAVDGYTVEWYSDPALTAPFNFSTPITSATIVYLGLTADSYTVTFEVGSASVTAPISQTIESGSCATIPDLTVEGYTVAWYSDSELTAPFNFSTPITSATILYLGLTAVAVPVDPVTYAVAFDVGSTSVIAPSSQTIVSGSCATDPDLVVEGHTAKWYSDSSCTAEFDFSTPITANTTLYLKLTAISSDNRDNANHALLIAGAALVVVCVILLMAMFVFGIPPARPFIILIDLALIAIGVIMIIFGV